MLKLEITEQELVLILTALRKLPMETVEELVNKVREQALSQLKK